jgi:putative isomerase
MWTAFMPLWARIASQEQAERLVREHLMNEVEFLSPFGIRSMARNEPGYDVSVGGNPSNWQGPVWVISNYLAFRGLVDYGFCNEARNLADRHLQLLAKDISANGCLHEYYDPETGKGLTHPGFFNWNSLAAIMANDLEHFCS